MKKTLCIAALTTLLFSDVALGYFDFPDVLDQLNNSFAFNFNALHMNYREDVLEAVPTRAGNVDDYGTVFGVNINVRKLFYDIIYTEFMGEYLTGKIKNVGFLQNGDTPLSYTYTSNFINTDGKLGVILIGTENFQLIPYGGVGFHYWKRTTGSYNNFKAFAGAKINIVLFEDLIFSPYVSMGTTLVPRAKVGSNKYSLGSKDIKEAGIEINYKWSSDIFVVGTVSYTSFAYGKSDWKPPASGSTQSSIEPNSKTNELRFGIGMRFSFM